jgi:adenylate cyclase
LSTAQRLVILFADVSGSSRLYEKLGDHKALEIIDRCVSVLSEIAHRHGGAVVKTIGDEVLATFPRESAAVMAAMEMHVGIVGMPDALEHSLAIHVGVHVGDVVVDSGDVFGDAVNVAARLTSLAKRSQVLLSGDIVDGLSTRLQTKARYLDSEVVRGREQPLELFDLLWESDSDLTEITSRPTRRDVAATLAVSYDGGSWQVNGSHPVLTLGRDKNADVIVLSRLASRHHGRIERRGDKFIYTDFSSNGSYVLIDNAREILVRRESVTLGLKGAISFGGPAKESADPVVSYSQ